MRTYVADALYGEIRGMLLCKASPVQIARELRLRSTAAVYNAKHNNLPPSKRGRVRRSTVLSKNVRARRSRAACLIKKTVTVVGERKVFAGGRPRKDGRARPYVVQKRKGKKLVFPSPAAVSRQMANEGFTDCSLSTIRRDLLSLGMRCFKRPRKPSLTEDQKVTRVKFAKALLRKPLKWFPTLLFTDEKWCDSNDNGGLHQWALTSSAKHVLIPRQQSQAAPKVFVWGCIGVGVKKLVFVEFAQGGMNAAEYRRQCVTSLRSIRKRNERVLMQDGAAVHWTPETRALIEQLGLDLLLNWPANSPDMNPLELLWALLQHRISERGPWGFEQLKAMVEEEWAKIPQEMIDRYVMAFRSILQEVVTAKGNAVKHGQ